MINERLTYERYGCSDNIIKIDLHNGFSIIANKMWNHDKGHYEVEYRITENSVDRWDSTFDEPVIIATDYKTINSAILRNVSDNLRDGHFDRYIERYKYELQCFDRGNDLFEQERLSNAL